MASLKETIHTKGGNLEAGCAPWVEGKCLSQEKSLPFSEDQICDDRTVVMNVRADRVCEFFTKHKAKTFRVRPELPGRTAGLQQAMKMHDGGPVGFLLAHSKPVVIWSSVSNELVGITKGNHVLKAVDGLVATHVLPADTTTVSCKVHILNKQQIDGCDVERLMCEAAVESAMSSAHLRTWTTVDLIRLTLKYLDLHVAEGIIARAEGGGERLLLWKAVRQSMARIGGTSKKFIDNFLTESTSILSKTMLIATAERDPDAIANDIKSLVADGAKEESQHNRGDAVWWTRVYTYGNLLLLNQATRLSSEGFRTIITEMAGIAQRGEKLTRAQMTELIERQQPATTMGGAGQPAGQPAATGAAPAPMDGQPAGLPAAAHCADTPQPMDMRPIWSAATGPYPAATGGEAAQLEGQNRPSRSRGHNKRRKREPASDEGSEDGEGSDESEGSEMRGDSEDAEGSEMSQPSDQQIDERLREPHVVLDHCQGFPANLNDVAKLLASPFSKESGFTQKDIRKSLGEGSRVVTFVASCGVFRRREVVSALAAEIFRNGNRGLWCAHIVVMATNEEQRSQGYGGRLMEYMKTYMSRVGVRALWTQMATGEMAERTERFWIDKQRFRKAPLILAKSTKLTLVDPKLEWITLELPKCGLS